MKYTNKFNLPAGFVRAVERDSNYAVAMDRLSVTAMLKGTKEAVLLKRHDDEIEIDVSEMVWLIFGRAVHSLLEEEGDVEITEEKLQEEINGIKVVGRLDNYNLLTHVVSDYKTCSVWKILFNDFSDWEKQGAMYAWLLQKAGFKVNEFKSIALIKDYSKSKARFDFSYPQLPLFTKPFVISAEQITEIEQFIHDKVDAYVEALKLADDDIPECSPEERWAKPDKWAVMKEGRKSAVRVLDSEAEAEEYMAPLKGKHYIEHRKGISTKCVDCCWVKNYCHFGREQEG